MASRRHTPSLWNVIVQGTSGIASAFGYPCLSMSRGDGPFFLGSAKGLWMTVVAWSPERSPLPLLILVIWEIWKGEEFMHVSEFLRVVGARSCPKNTRRGKNLGFDRWKILDHLDCGCLVCFPKDCCLVSQTLNFVLVVGFSGLPTCIFFLY